MLFVHQGPYEGGVFKFRIDFPMASFPLNLPSVRFTTPRQVFSPLVHFETGDFDYARLFDQADHTFCDANYINGKLVHCFDGFSKHLLKKVWDVFHDPLIFRALTSQQFGEDNTHGSSRCDLPNPLALEAHQKDLTLYFGLIKKYALSQEAETMLGMNAPDSLLQINSVRLMTEEDIGLADQTLEFVRELISKEQACANESDKGKRGSVIEGLLGPL